MLLLKIIKRLPVLILSLVLMTGSVGVIAASANATTTPSLSLQDAVSMAMAYSPALKAAEDGIKVVTQENQDASQALGGYQPEATGANGSPSSEMVFKGLATSNIGLQTAQEDLTAVQGEVYVNTLTDYYAVLSAQAALDKAQSDLDSNQQALEAAQATYGVGLITQDQLQAASSQEDTSAKALASSQQALDKTYVNLDIILGLTTDNRPVLTGLLTYAPFQVNSLGAEVSKALTSGYAMVSSESNVNGTTVLSEGTLNDLKSNITLAQLQVDFPWTGSVAYPVFQEPQETGPGVDAAQQSLSGANNSVGQQLRGDYNDIMSLEANYSALQSALQSAQSSLKDTTLMFDVGLTTKDKVTAAEAAVADLQSEITGVVFNHEVLVANFQWMTGDLVVDTTSAS
jgi:outer membrane protein